MAASSLFPKLPQDWMESKFVLNSSSADRSLTKDIFLRIYHKSKLETGRLLFVVHGQAEQSDRYQHLPFYLNQDTDAVALIDLPGHGKTPGIRGHIENYDQYTTAAIAGLEKAKQWFASKDGFNSSPKQVHWLGHSMGGLITLRTMIKQPNLQLTSVITSAPLIKVAMPVPALKSLGGKLIEPILGSLKLDNEIDGSLVSHDENVINEYSLNPLNHHFVTPRFFVQTMRELDELQKYSGPFPYHWMLILPLADKIVCWKTTFEFYQNMRMNSGLTKKINSFPGFYHESLNEIGKERAFVAISNWLQGFPS